MGLGNADSISDHCLIDWTIRLKCPACAPPPLPALPGLFDEDEDEDMFDEDEELDIDDEDEEDEDEEDEWRARIASSREPRRRGGTQFGFSRADLRPSSPNLLADEDD